MEVRKQWDYILKMWKKKTCPRRLYFLSQPENSIAQ
jgi:hypothetical protein